MLFGKDCTTENAFDHLDEDNDGEVENCYNTYLEHKFKVIDMFKCFQVNLKKYFQVSKSKNRLLNLNIFFNFCKTMF